MSKFLCQIRTVIDLPIGVSFTYSLKGGWVLLHWMSVANKAKQLACLKLFNVFSVHKFRTKYSKFNLTLQRCSKTCPMLAHFCPLQHLFSSDTRQFYTHSNIYSSILSTVWHTHYHRFVKASLIIDVVFFSHSLLLVLHTNYANF